MLSAKYPTTVAIVTFTKSFVPSSILEGLTYDETIEFGSQDSADKFVSFLKKHTNKPVSPCAGSAYIVLADSIKVEYA